ncbi:lytic murein transglycosylase B [Paenalcaligenes faecalis]|uniref:lytic murein transglycosylase B n=1 Tax=Paenalcaligenes faecalis TaxID=2980099 RepID=UPI0022B9445B|nr:lytic murein transglycosylase B [Paenalcaligenes faecalis]
MLRKTRLIQASFYWLLLAGCATSNTTTQYTTPVNTATVTIDNTATTNTPVVKALDSHPKSGDSIQGRQDYFQADGSLSPYLQHWANELAQLQSIPLANIETLLKSASYNAQVARLMAPSKGRIKRSWSTYKNRFIEPIRIKAGLEFWDKHASTIDRIAAQYGVPPEIIVAIIGVETIYGNYTGDFRVIDALLTLGFSYPDNSRPERGQLFRDQLADLIVLDHQGKLHASSATGSFAGAMGLPQFMPGSLMRFAVDADGDGRIDLHHSIPDVIASVANFLIEHGWQPGLPVFAPTTVNDTTAKKLVDGGLKPLLSWSQIEQAQAATRVDSGKATWTQAPLGIIDLAEESQGTAEYRVATPNFFAITSYNRSYFYATTVADFAEILATRHHN